FHALRRQPEAGLDIGRILLADARSAAQPEQGLDMAHHLPAGGFRLEHLPDKALEGQSEGINALAAVGAVVLGTEELGWQEIAKVALELDECGLADGMNGALPEGGQAGTEGGKEGCMHVR